MGSKTANALIEELKRDAEKGELLLWASARGLTADVIELVQTGADPSAKDKRSRQAVHYAASNGHVDILEYLFTKGVLLDAEDDVGRGALHYAAAGGHAACVSFLLARECWRDAPDAADDTPLHLAARAGSLEAVRALREAGAKLALPNKRSLTPFAAAVLAGQLSVAEFLGEQTEGGLAAALAARYREAPLLHLAAGLGQAVAVEWLVRQQRCDPTSPSPSPDERRYTPLHAAALSGDVDTVVTLLRLGADPLNQTSDGKLPLELVPTAAPPKAPPPPPPPGSAAAAAAAEDPDAAAAAAAADPELLRSARRAFRALARAAAAHGGVELGGKGSTTAAAAAATAAAGMKQGWSKAGVVAGAAAADGAGLSAEKGSTEEGEEYDSPAAICLRQLSSMSHEQQIGKVESYARMDERQLQELSYLDVAAQAAVTALRQAMAMVELFGAVAALRCDEDFQSDIRDARVREALAEAKRTNDLSRFEDLPGVMSVAAKFKRLHAVTRKAGGLQVVIDDLRVELPGNDPTSTAAKMGEMRAAEREAAEAAVRAVLASVAAAVPDRMRTHTRNAAATAAAAAAAANRTPAANSGGEGRTAAAAAATSTSEVGPGGQGGGGGGGGEEGFRQEEDEQAFKVRMAHRERVDRLRAAATSAWPAGGEGDAAVGYVDRLEKKFEAEAAAAEGGRRWRLAEYVGEEMAQSLTHTFKALVLTAAAFLVMWLLGLMPHQQTAALLAREAALRRAAEAAAAAERLSQLEALSDVAVAVGNAAAAVAAGSGGGGGSGGEAAAPTCGARL